MLLQLSFVVLIFFLCYEFLWEQIEQKNQEEIRLLQQKATFLQWTNKTVALIKQNKKTGQHFRKVEINADDFLSTTQQQLRGLQLTTTPNISAAGEKQVRIVFSGVSFAQLTTWLINFTNKYKVKVISAQIDAKKIPGEVQAEVILGV